MSQPQSFLEILKTVDEVQKDFNTSENHRIHLKNALLEQERQEAYAIGYERGLKEGFLQGVHNGHTKAKEVFDEERYQEIQDYLFELDKRMQAFEKQKSVWFVDIEKRLSLIAFYLCEKILHTELSEHRERLIPATLHIAKAALKEIYDVTEVTLRVHPFDMPYVEKYKEDLLHLSPQLKSIELVQDHHIPLGCMIETNFGVIDAHIDHMLQKLLEEEMP